MHKGTIMFGFGILLVAIVVALLLYYIISKPGFNSGFKSSFKDLTNADPITKLYVKNRYLRDMYGTQLNVDSGETLRTYMEFLQNPGRDTPTPIYDSVVEIVEFMKTADLYGQTNDGEKLQVYIRALDALLTDFFNSKYITAERLDGVNQRDSKLLDEYTTTDLDSAWEDYIGAAAPGKDEHDIAEQQTLSIMRQDFDVSRFVEALESDPSVVGEGVKSSKQAYDEAGKRHRLADRPYPGSTNPRVIADDPSYPLDKYDATKDRNYPKPRVLSGQTRDLEVFTAPWRGNRVAYNFNGF